MILLSDLNAASEDAFCAALEGVVERAPWAVAEAAAMRPFADLDALHGALMARLRMAPRDRLLAFLNAHEPLVAGPLPDSLTEASRREQGAVPLAALIEPEALGALNAEYLARFGFPFIICLRRYSAPEVLQQLGLRLASDVETEFSTALDEVSAVVRFRLSDKDR
ncbi:OHCU decarboxylase [Pseudoroseomonas deserti]|uniref:2-oxo-4-hydroxy-4-carboxy-5-ureidoimidazoline decarboxylase n=1 Tax=Teichococcus deserti TaxID=1817963 RepID=A0A1V2H439_9PROT|nr:2-oxo-4-hydroxy-4-carboxy-5-ureidoimidazoline decarboxylase [Pseudoroseomonas deserti]ONG53175.1 OHCU decarboxylase [Pseudoroseomonas deserti]